MRCQPLYQKKGSHCSGLSVHECPKELELRYRRSGAARLSSAVIAIWQFSSTPGLRNLVRLQPVTGADADELVAEFRDDDRGSLFRLEGTGPQRSAVVTSARGNEHQLEKVRHPSHGRGDYKSLVSCESPVSLLRVSCECS